MQTRLYKDLYNLITSLCGVSRFADSEEDDIMNFINRRLTTAYNASQAWPRYLVVGEARPVGSFVLKGLTAASFYESDTFNSAFELLGKDSNGHEVYYNMNVTTSGAPHVFIKNNSTKAWQLKLTQGQPTIDVDTGVVTTSLAPAVAVVEQDTTTDSSEYDYPWLVNRWTLPGSYTQSRSYPIFELKSIIPYESTIVTSTYTNFSATPRQTIGEVLKIHRTQPFNNKSAVEYEFYNDEKGAVVLNAPSTTNNELFVTYKKPLTLFTTSSLPGLSSEAVPAEFFPYLAHATYADFLTMDGQTSRAVVEQDRANELLALELEKVDIMSNNQIPVTKFSTYVNRQSR